MIKKLDAKLALLLTVVAALVVLLVGWFGLIASERSKASHVDAQVAQQQDQLTSAQSLIANTSKAAAEAQSRAAMKVLPDDPQMSQVVREITTDSGTAGTQLDSVVPAALTTVGSAQAVPITVTIEGKYFAIRHFLALLQAGASFKDDKVIGKGRLYSVDSISFTTSTSSAPSGPSGATAPTVPAVKNALTATIDLNVFIAGAPPAATAPPATDSSSSDTTTTASGSTP